MRTDGKHAIINYDFKITKSYPYRTAMVRGIFLRIPSGETTKKLESEFAKALGGMIDNHTCYELTSVYTNEHIYARYSDNEVLFGLGIEEGNF